MSLSDDIERLPLLRAPLAYSSQKVVRRSSYYRFLPDIAMVSARCSLEIEWLWGPILSWKLNDYGVPFCSGNWMTMGSRFVLEIEWLWGPILSWKLNDCGVPFCPGNWMTMGSHFVLEIEWLWGPILSWKLNDYGVPFCIALFSETDKEDNWG